MTIQVLDTIRTRLPGFEPAEFWQESPTRERLGAAVRKYEALTRAARLAEGDRGSAYRELLASVSARWPGGLRESELIGVRRVAERRVAAEAWLDADPRPPATRIEAAVRCWLELHELIRDQLEFRRGRERGEVGTSASFAMWLAGQPDRGPRWPGVERLPEVVGDKLRVRGAYLWLAARAGLDLPGLNELLFERAGHWDSRPDDPAWSRAP